MIGWWHGGCPASLTLQWKHDLDTFVSHIKGVQGGDGGGTCQCTRTEDLLTFHIGFKIVRV